MPSDALLRSMVAFGGVLRREGVAADPARVRGAVQALEAIDLTERDQAYWALRAALVSRREDLAAFDRAFAAFFDRAPSLGADRSGAPGEPGAAGPEPEEAPRTVEREAPELADAAEDPGAGDDAQRGVAVSADERLAELDFRAYGPDEMARAQRLIARIAVGLPRRRSRRLDAARTGTQLDTRQTLRAAMATGGDPVRRAWRRPGQTVRKLVFVVDVSGSMEVYARPMLMFLQAAVRAHRRVEAFSFGTRLTRLTPHLAGRTLDGALHDAARAVPDWAGGTRIGENLQAFSTLWGRRGLTRGATVVIVSDGWERGDAALLAAQMAALQRAAHRVVWVNPLAGDPEYQPLAAGMAAALPYVDEFLPGHNLRSLEALAAVLEALPATRARRRPDARTARFGAVRDVSGRP